MTPCPNSQKQSGHCQRGKTSLSSWVPNLGLQIRLTKDKLARETDRFLFIYQSLQEKKCDSRRQSEFGASIALTEEREGKKGTYRKTNNFEVI